MTAFLINVVYAQDINLLPKYGMIQKNEAQITADKKFLASMDEYFKGDRKKASEITAMRGWQFLRKGDAETAMKRFNQAWLLDNKNGTALWGMAAIQNGTHKTKESLKLFAEAEQYISNNIDFSADYARAIGYAAIETKDDSLLKDALFRYEQLYKKAPQHTLNLQNWAIILYFIGRYDEAWEKIKLAEATPRGKELDQNFIIELRKKLSRKKE